MRRPEAPWVVEGEDGNIEALRAMQAACRNPAVRFVPVKGADHFDLLGAVHGLISKKIAAGPPSLDAAEVQAAVDQDRVAAREAADLRALADARRAGHALSATKTVRYHLFARARLPLQAMLDATRAQGFEPGAIEGRRDRKGPYFALVVKRRLALKDLDALLSTSAAIDGLCKKFDAVYGTWDVE